MRNVRSQALVINYNSSKCQQAQGLYANILQLKKQKQKLKTQSLLFFQITLCGRMHTPQFSNATTTRVTGSSQRCSTLRFYSVRIATITNFGFNVSLTLSAPLAAAPRCGYWVYVPIYRSDVRVLRIQPTDNLGHSAIP